MKNRFRLISRGSRGGALYCVDGSTGKRTSLSSCSLSDIFTKFRRLSLGIGFHDLRFTRKTHAGVMGCSPHGEKGNREKRERHLFMSQSGRGDKQNHCQEARGGVDEGYFHVLNRGNHRQRRGIKMPFMPVPFLRLFTRSRATLICHFFRYVRICPIGQIQDEDTAVVINCLSGLP